MTLNAWEQKTKIDTHLVCEFGNSMVDRTEIDDDRKLVGLSLGGSLGHFPVTLQAGLRLGTSQALNNEKVEEEKIYCSRCVFTRQRWMSPPFW